MLNYQLESDTQAILLLCASFGQNRERDPKPLTLGEYNIVVNWLKHHQLTPKNLLEGNLKSFLEQNPIDKLDPMRIIALLERGMMLSLAVEQWASQGLWILGRNDSNYPKLLKKNLRESAPPILYGVGKIELLAQGGLAIVGSRNVDEEGLKYTKTIAELCANEGIQVVSGGAKGVDQQSMLASLDAGGTAVGVLADSLTKAALKKEYRQSLQVGKLALICACDPSAGFNTGNAMARNKYIYALSNYALVVSSDVGKGGTWTGAMEALKKIKNTPVFVRKQGNIPEGNLQLLKNGAFAFPNFSPELNLTEFLKNVSSHSQEPSLLPAVEQLSLNLFEAPAFSSSSSKIIKQSEGFEYSPQNLYQVVLPFILHHLKEPKTDKFLAESLELKIEQLTIWLQRAVEDGKVIKRNDNYLCNVSQDNLLLP